MHLNLNAGTYLITFHSGIKRKQNPRQTRLPYHKWRECTDRLGVGEKCVWVGVGWGNCHSSTYAIDLRPSDRTLFSRFSRFLVIPFCHISFIYPLCSLCLIKHWNQRVNFKNVEPYNTIIRLQWAKSTFDSFSAQLRNFLMRHCRTLTTMRS